MMEKWKGQEENVRNRLNEKNYRETTKEKQIQQETMKGIDTKENKDKQKEEQGDGVRWRLVVTWFFLMFFPCS